MHKYDPCAEKKNQQTQHNTLQVNIGINIITEPGGAAACLCSTSGRKEAATVTTQRETKPRWSQQE